MWTIFTALTATTLMTLFSYLTAWIFGQPFKEPFLLAVLLNNFKFTDQTSNRVLGWILHYLLGVVFVIGFQMLLSMGWITSEWLCALVYGTVIGIIGIIGWKVMFRLSDRNPHMDYSGYYGQLFIAHLIFVFTMVGCYRLFNYLFPGF